jgi:hypothetical protein
MFPVINITEDVAVGIRTGLRGVKSIQDVYAVEVIETREAIEIPGE